MELTLFKNELCGWTEIVIGDERGVMECDRDATNAAYAHLEQFTSDFSVLFYYSFVGIFRHNLIQN